jgi:hypothetical protein
MAMAYDSGRGKRGKLWKLSSLWISLGSLKRSAPKFPQIIKWDIFL